MAFNFLLVSPIQSGKDKRRESKIYRPELNSLKRTSEYLGSQTISDSVCIPPWARNCFEDLYSLVSKMNDYLK